MTVSKFSEAAVLLGTVNLLLVWLVSTLVIYSITVLVYIKVACVIVFLNAFMNLLACRCLCIFRTRIAELQNSSIQWMDHGGWCVVVSVPVAYDVLLLSSLFIKF